MTDDDSNHVDDNLDAFEDDFFQREPEADEAEEQEVSEDEDEEVSETELETSEDDSSEEDEGEEEEAPEEEPKPKAKKSARERIDELTAEKYQLRRELDALRRDFEANKTQREEKPEPKPVQSELPSDAPSPDAVDDEGNPIYKLGEFDPKFISDLTKFTIAQETKSAKEAEAREATQKQVEAAQAEIQQKWQTNLAEVEKEEPEIRENIANLVEVFKDVEPAYGDFLALSIMNSEYGPQVMNYLALNIGEAQKIVASGPEAAMRHIGRIEARFDKPTEKQPKKVSKAGKPPEIRSRGAQGRFSIREDTDDLDAFERAFYKER